MKTKYYFFAALATVMLASCADDQFVGDNSPTTGNETEGSIQFALNAQNATRAGEFVGATAAAKLGGMFVVEGTKGDEQSNSPSTTVVFDNYLVGYTANTAGKTESNTNNWEYVGLQTGITSPLRMSGDTWTALHATADYVAATQTIKYWDYSTTQYDFIAWSTGEREAVTGDAVADTKVKVTRINTGETLRTNGFKMTAMNANDLLQCYYTDITTVPKAKYGKPVTLTFKNMAAKVRVALYETVPGYSVKNVKFYSAESDNSEVEGYNPTDLGTVSSAENAVLFTTGEDKLPQSGEVTVLYPHIGTEHRGNPSAEPAVAQTKDYNKASVTVNSITNGATSTTQAFGALTNQYRDETGNEPDGKYLGITLPTATFAGDATKAFYTAVIPNTNGKPLTLRVDYTLVATDGSDEEINVYGAKAVVPSTYTVWQPNYAYTYIFKISDNTNGWTSQTSTDPAGLFPITFDAMVASFTDANAEQTTVTTVATPSITTYQQGHDWAHKDEYSKSQKAGVSTAVKDVYVQVMDNSGATPTLKGDLNGTNKSLLFAVSKEDASEAEVMDALQNRTSWDSEAPVTSPVGRNGITLTTNANISNTETNIVNGVDDQPITKIAGTAISAGQVAKIDIDQLATGTYAYVYCTTVPSTNETVYHVVSGTEAKAAHDASTAKYYEVTLTGTEEALASGTAAAGKVYFVKNVDAKGNFVSYTFKQTKVGEDVTGLIVKDIPGSKTSDYTDDSAKVFYFDVYNQNNGEYAVKVIKVVD